MAQGTRSPTVEILVRDEATVALERERARIRAAAANHELFTGLESAFKGFEGAIQSLARTVNREFRTILGLTGAGGFLGAGLVLAIDKTAQAVSGLARSAEENRYLADTLGVTTAQLNNLVARGQALGMSTEQSRSGIESLLRAMRDLRLMGQDAPVYKALVEAGGASGQRVGDQLIAMVKGPGGYEAGIRQFAKLQSGMNLDAQRKLSEIFGTSSLAFRDLYTVKNIPSIIDLAGPQARRLSIAMASLNVSFDNLKTTLAGAVMPAFEGLSQTLDKFLQGPGKKIVQQFADWLSTLNIPWDRIAKGLVGAVEALRDIFAWGKKTAEDLEPIIGKPKLWGPVLKKMADLVIPGFVNHLLTFAKALMAVGQHADVIAKITAAVRGGEAPAPPTAKPSASPLLPMPTPQQLRGTGRTQGQSPSAPRAMGLLSTGGGYTPGGGEDPQDTDQLSEQVHATSRQVLQLANYISSQALTTDVSGAGGLAGLAGQIRTGRVGRAGTTIGGGGGGTRGGGGGRRGGGGDSGIPDTGTNATGTTKGVTSEGMALLDTIATWEAEPAFKNGQRAGWNTMIGNVRFDPNTDEHPKRAYPWLRGYVGGAGVSYASGRYQETINTYYENVARSKRLHPGMKVSGWSPEAQNIRNWDKAQDIYARRYRNLGIPSLTGNLQKDLEANKNNPAMIGRMARALSGEWTTAPGGHERSKQTGKSESQYSTQYLKMLARTSQDPALANQSDPASPSSSSASSSPTAPTSPPAPTSPIVWSNLDEIARLEREAREAASLPAGGFTPIPRQGGSSRINLNVNVRGRSARVSSESSGDMGSATISRDKDPSGGIEGFSPG
jgi:muramidase (phage lysozyme)